MDVGAWLRVLGLERYEQTFHDGEIDLQVLPELTDADLKELGIPLGARKKLIKAIAALSGSAELVAGISPASGAMSHDTRHADAERRQLTIMFCDLVDSTALAEQLDPEDLRTVIQAYQQCCAETIDRFGGYIARFMGDGVLAYFGYPQAHEDDAERAVRAGLDLVAAIDRLRPLGDLTIRARIGIATGEVVVGDLVSGKASDREAVVGETPNLAARLQAVAGSGCVVISRKTKHLLAGLFEYSDLGEHQLKGLCDPVQIWRVLGKSTVESRFEAKHLTGLAPMVGREDEVALLSRLWDQVEAGKGQILLLSGQPGIGKSRLIGGLLDLVAERPHMRLRYYCSPFRTQSGLHPILDQMERAAGYAQDDPPRVKLHKLEHVLGRATEHPVEAAALLAPLLAIPGDGQCPSSPTALTPQQQKAKVFEVMLQQVIGLAARQPLLMIVDDAHWIDPTSVEMFDIVVDRLPNLPVMLLVAFRPDFTPPWTNAAHVTSISLDRLGHDQVAAIVERLTGGKRLPPELLDKIVTKTDGVPLFVEELTKSVLESGAVQDEGECYAFAGPLQRLTIPSTLQDSLMARLDRLDIGKEVAQVGAVIGREFPHRLLAAAVASLGADETEAALERLVAAELIFRKGTPPQTIYRFKHALVQDTAYNSLLKTKRHRLHREIATLLEEEFPQTGETEPELLAHHYQQAGLPEKAIPFGLRAGDAAVARYASVEARAHYQRALEMAQSLPPSEEASRSQIQAVLKLASVAQNRQQFEVDLVQLEHARTLAHHLGDQQQLCRIHYWIGRTNYVLGRFEEGVRSAEDALHVAESLGDAGADDDTAGPVNLLARIHCLRGEARLASEFAVRSLAQMQKMGNHIEEAAVAGVLAFAYGQQGRFEEAFDAASRGVELAGNLGHLPTLAAAFHFRGVVHGWCEDLASAVADFEQAMAYSEKSGDLFRKYVIHGWRGEAYLIVNDVESAEQDLAKCLALADEIGTSFHRPAFQAFLAQIRLLRGDVPNACRLCEEAIAGADESAQDWGRSIALRVNAAASLETNPPNLEQAERAAASALTIQERLGCRCDLARTLLVSGRVFVAKGDLDGATTAIETARQMFREMGMSCSQEAAEAALTDLSSRRFDSPR